MKKIAVGIIGASLRGWAAINHVPALKVLPDYQLRAISTSGREPADAAPEDFDARASYDNHVDLIADLAVHRVFMLRRLFLHRMTCYSLTRSSGSQVLLLESDTSPFGHLRTDSDGSAGPVAVAGVAAPPRPTTAVALKPVKSRARNVPAIAIEQRRTPTPTMLIAFSPRSLCTPRWEEKSQLDRSICSLLNFDLPPIRF